jgi:hypothetical protein
LLISYHPNQANSFHNRNPYCNLIATRCEFPGIALFEFGRMARILKNKTVKDLNIGDSGQE